MTRRRSLAQRLVLHTQEAMPPGRRPWALAMAAELDHIEDDGAALVFALGAVWTGYREGVRLWSNWLRLGRWGVALWTAVLGLGLFYMSLWLQRLPESTEPSVPFSTVMVLLGCAYLGAGWSLMRRRLRLYAGLVTVISTLITTTALAFALGTHPALPWNFYLALLRGGPAPLHAFYAALLLEQFVFIAGLTAAGAFFWRFEGRRASA